MDEPASHRMSAARTLRLQKVRESSISATALLDRRLRAALEHRSRAKVGDLHHQLPQGFVRAATAAATAAAAGPASGPAAHVVRAVPHGSHGAQRVAACE